MSDDTRVSDVGNTVIVVGAGIVGASISYHLAARGQRVTLVDASLPASGATGASFAWVGRSSNGTTPAERLRASALDDYRRLESEVGSLGIRWSGSLTWGQFAEPDDPTPRVRVSDVEPHFVGDSLARYRPHDAGLDPTAVTERLIATAQSLGARLVVGSPVTAIESENGRVTGVATTEGVLSAPTVVLAAGVGSVALAAGLGVELPVRSSPAVLVRLRATPQLVRTIVASSELEVRQDQDGTLLVTLEYAGEAGSTDLVDTTQRARDRVLRSFPDAGHLEVLSAEVGWRPMPIDDQPIIGPTPGVRGLYLAVMHAGVTLAGTVGRLVSGELSDGVDADELSGCRPDRFGAVRRSGPVSSNVLRR